MEERLYYYKAELVRIIDGDTIVVDIDKGFDDWKKNQRIRLLEIDAPEVRTRDLEEKARGVAATEHLRSLIKDKELIIHTVTTDGFGRWLAYVYVDGVDIGLKMIEDGHAVPMF